LLNFQLKTVKSTQALFTKLQLVPESYRVQFRSLTKNQSQTFSDFAFKLNDLFTRWLTGADVIDKIDLLKETFLIEQFSHSLKADLKQWLVDQKPKTLSDAARLCDQYIALRNSATKSTFSDVSLVSDRNSQSSTNKGRWTPKSKPPNSPKQWNSRPQSNQPQNSWLRPQNMNGSPKCYNQHQSQQQQQQHGQQTTKQTLLW
jgi:hypothetical protein